MTHIIFDSYIDCSTKDGERTRRSTRDSSVDLSALNESVPIPHQLEKFWNSSLNEQNLQLFARHVGERDLRDVVLSGMIVDEELVSA